MREDILKIFRTYVRHSILDASATYDCHNWCFGCGTILEYATPTLQDSELEVEMEFWLILRSAIYEQRRN